MLIFLIFIRINNSMILKKINQFLIFSLNFYCCRLLLLLLILLPLLLLLFGLLLLLPLLLLLLLLLLWWLWWWWWLLLFSVGTLGFPMLSISRCAREIFTLSRGVPSSPVSIANIFIFSLKLSFSGTCPTWELCCCFCFSASLLCLGSLNSQVKIYSLSSDCY